MLSSQLHGLPGNAARPGSHLGRSGLCLLTLLILFLAPAGPAAAQAYRPRRPRAAPATAAAASPQGEGVAAPAGAGRAGVSAGPASQLWVSAAGGPARLLATGIGQHFGQPIWSPDGSQVAYLVTPTGTETAPLARWWVVDVEEGGVGAPRRLPAAPTWVPAAARPAPPPGWHGGPARRIARPSSAHPMAPAALTPPALIRVLHTALNASYGCWPDVAVGQVMTFTLEDYVAHVVPAESPDAWGDSNYGGMEELKAQAVAARTYAWYEIANADGSHPAWDVTDDAYYQVMCDGYGTNSSAATAATAGFYVSYDGQPILAQYSADNGDPTLYGDEPYLEPVMDPVDLGDTLDGHGHGMSQWGAYFWASDDGWNAIQILAHYYSGIEVVDPDHHDPLLALLQPWPGTWLTGSTAYLDAHANPEWAPSVSFSAPGLSAADDDPAPDWSALWPLPGSLASPTTVTAQTLTRTATLSLAGMDLQPPTGQITLPATSTTQTVTVGVTASDAGSGVGGVALGGDWQVQAGDFAFTGTSSSTFRAGGRARPRVRAGRFASAAAPGQLVTDPETASGLALALPAGTGGTWQTSFIDPLPVDTLYEAYLRVKYQPLGADSGAPIAHVELVDPYYPSEDDPAPVAFFDLHQGDFRQAGAYQEFTTDFQMNDNGETDQDGRLLARITASGGVTLTIDRLRILYEPESYAAQVPYLLAPQLGLQTVVAKILDNASNPSADLIGTTQWVTSAQTSEWQLISPTTWVSSTAQPAVIARVTGSIDALVTACLSHPISGCGASARYSTDGGIDWSAWQGLTPTTLSSNTSELKYTWQGGQGGGNNRVEFWVGSGNADSVSPRWPVRVDTVAPSQATVDAPPIVAPNEPFTVTWSASDAAGILSYDVRTSPDPANAPWQDWLVAATATGAQHTGIGSGALYVEARARDVAGNLGPWSAPGSAPVGDHAGFLPSLTR